MTTWLLFEIKVSGCYHAESDSEQRSTDTDAGATGI